MRGLDARAWTAVITSWRDSRPGIGGPSRPSGLTHPPDRHPFGKCIALPTSPPGGRPAKDLKERQRGEVLLSRKAKTAKSENGAPTTYNARQAISAFAPRITMSLVATGPIHPPVCAPKTSIRKEDQLPARPCLNEGQLPKRIAIPALPARISLPLYSASTQQSRIYAGSTVAIARIG